MDEEASVFEPEPVYELLPVCKCLFDDTDRVDVPHAEPKTVPPRKQKILSTVARTENYLRDRRIPELIRFMLTKLIAEAPDKPIAYLEQLLNDCMLFRAGHGSPPVVYEIRHLEAVIKSFDPGQRGWLSAGQIRRIYTTLGLTSDDCLDLEDRVSTEMVFNNLKKTQESELLALLKAGLPMEEMSEDETSDNSTD